MEYTREKTLLGNNVNDLQVAPYFERARNQYTDKSVGDFVHLKDGGATGDGSTDDTSAVQNTFNQYGDGSKIIYVDAGTYILTDTVTIPKDAKIVGETWSQFAASGSKFSDPLNPRVMLKVGNEGDVGTVEMQDLILTTKGGTAGAVLMEWNVKAASSGAAALWDVHARVGGATGTGLTHTECPPITTGTNPVSCQAASLLLHVTKKASGYFDNMWLWVADHTIDDPDLNDANNNMPQLSVYSARGMLIESQEATWLYGTASEHNTFYQYNFHEAHNIFTTMIQTESAYYQPTPKPPAPFNGAVGKFIGDPNYDCKGGDFDGCDESWAVMMTGSENIHIGGAGTYTWFSTYSQDCVDSHSCQKTLWYVDSNYDNVRLQHVIGIGAKNVMVVDGKGISAADNLATTFHPAWSQISIYDVPSKGKAPGDNICDPNDVLISNATMPAGSFMPWGFMDPSSAGASTKQYITIGK
jgi:Pectate lyase superfamily protein